MATRITESGPSSKDADIPAPPLNLQEVGQLLVKHYGIETGKFEVTVEFQLAVGVLGPDPEQMVPSAIAGVSKLGLRRLPPDRAVPATLIVDAAAIQTKQPAAKKARRTAK